MANTARLYILLLSRDASSASFQMQQRYNKTLCALDGIVSGRCDQFDLNTPPALVLGEVYKIGSSPTGAWASNADDIAIACYSAFTTGGEPNTLVWQYITPADGLVLYDSTNDDLLLLVDAATDAWEVIPRQGTTITALTDSTGGSAGSSLSAVPATDSVNGASVINDNFATLNAKLDALVLSLENAGFLA